MSQATPTRRVVSLVISDDTDPRAIIAELLNCLEEHEERAVLAYTDSPDFPLFRVCREIELERADEEELS